MQSKKRKEFAFGGGVWGLGVGGRENLLGGGKFIVCMEQGKWGGGGVGGGGAKNGRICLVGVGGWIFSLKNNTGVYTIPWHLYHPYEVSNNIEVFRKTRNFEIEYQ